MSKIITITLNPSIDKSISVPNLIADQKIKCNAVTFEPGGGGINISRALQRLGGKSEAFFFAGGNFGNFFIELIKSKKIAFQAFKIKKETRECIIVFDESNSNQYLLDVKGPEVAVVESNSFLKTISKLKEVDYLVASGSLPLGVPNDYFVQLAKIAKKMGAKFILDTSGEPLKLALNEGVYLIKPNVKEMGLLFGIEKMDLALAKEKAIELVQSKKCEIVVVSLGADGALVVTKDFAEHFPAPKVKKISTVGAGDSMVAGIVLKLSKGKSIQEAIKYGLASGSATTMNPGGVLCTKEDADRLYLINEASK
ncbi:1-phosphofructokinase family hexose kinase [Flavobacterium paronense]|uniref:1-phosphofructokinase family hexose kinase n=1 Tax=Flavobacterium paronense TaxID=1392775 RepID=A0ABV5GEP0_9FLAO|nr:1-phosphofructokinase family hexose kinase [Flavobacterium paronense]MDN3678054.1 1-phosphofructokinase family hexose kinase [Flavobacterium paronense]